jgi:hypothetical protein
VTQFQEDVTILSVLKKMLVLANMLMLQSAMNFYFSLELYEGRVTKLVGIFVPQLTVIRRNNVLFDELEP